MDAARTNRTRWTFLVITLAALALLASACSDNNKTSTSGGSGSSPPSTNASAAGGCNTTGAQIDYSKLTGTLKGTGSTFQDVFNQEAKNRFASVAPGVTVNYAKSGSSAGKGDLAKQADVQFAGTDSLISSSDPPFQGGDVLYFPTVGAPITVSYNLNGVDQLQLSPATLAGIFSGQITTWNDPKIAADNPNATLPSKPIVVVHRTDGSGTTNNFTTYLTKAAPDVWTLGKGDTITWPTSTQGAEKNSGVAALIQSTDGAVGYVDLADAANANLQYASIKNSAGNFVQPTLDAAAAALAGATVNPDLTYSPLDPPGDNAYPITSPTWIIVYKKQPNAATADALKGWLNFILTQGQTFANDVGFSSLPCDMAQKAVDQLNQITA
jgi:phosphate transport system substrate-binding protein